MRDLLARLIATASGTPPAPIDRLVVLRLADLRQMDRWGIRIRGESLAYYFDLGSLDDVDPRYPVTPEEADALIRAMETLLRQDCTAPYSLRPWRSHA